MTNEEKNKMITYRELKVEETEKFWEFMNTLDQETEYMMYEPGERSKDLDRIFEPIKNCIKTLLPKVLEKQSHFPKIEIKPYSIDQQRHLAYAVLNWEKYDLSKG